MYSYVGPLPASDGHKSLKVQRLNKTKISHFKNNMPSSARHLTAKSRLIPSHPCLRSREWSGVSSIKPDASYSKIKISINRISNTFNLLCCAFKINLI